MLGDVHYEWTVNGTKITSASDLSSFLYSFPTVGIATVHVQVSNDLDSMEKEAKISVINGEGIARLLVRCEHYSPPLSLSLSAYIDSGCVPDWN